MNDDKKAFPNVSPGGDPSASSDADENPWDDDDGGGRTLATDGPSFEMPSNIPSPITVPPPAPDPPKTPGTMPLIGFTPPAPGTAPKAPGVPPSAPDLSVDALAAAAAAGAAPALKRPVPIPPRPTGNTPSAPRVAAAAAKAPASARMPIAPIAPPPPSARMPIAAPVSPPQEGGDEEAWPNADDQQDDGPTMAVASPAMSARPGRDDVVNPPPQIPPSSPLASTGFAPTDADQALKAMRAMAVARSVDKDAETMSLPGDAPFLPPMPHGADAEETTRAVSREELMRHQDAHVVVGQDAIGDEATLAIAPGMVDLGLGPGAGPSGIGAALAEALQSRDVPPPPPRHGHAGPMSPQMPQVPAFPPPPQNFQNNPMPVSSGHLPAAHPHGQPPPWGAPPGFDPMLPQGPSGPMSSPMSSPMSAPYPSSGHQLSYGGPNPQQVTALGPGGGPQQMQQQQQQQMQQMQPGAPPWMTQPSPPPAGMTLPSRFTPQVILLVVVGAVCLAIFIIGIVLFVTTKF